MITRIFVHVGGSMTLYRNKTLYPTDLYSSLRFSELAHKIDFKMWSQNTIYLRIGDSATY